MNQSRCRRAHEHGGTTVKRHGGRRKAQGLMRGEPTLTGFGLIKQRNMGHCWGALSLSAPCLSHDDDTRGANLMTTRVASDPKHWRNRAREARTRAGEMDEPVAKRQMLGIARGYERLAERAEERQRTSAPPSEKSRIS